MTQVTKKSSNVVKDNFYRIVAVAVVLLGIFFVINSNKPTTTSENNASPSATLESTQSGKPNTLAYRGQEGKTALAILKEVTQTETSGEGEMAFVVSINGYKPDVSKEFWAFYVNDKQAEVGAGSYATKSTDLIEWRLEEIKP